ncbi:uncharacterized protein LOC114247215 [Bombyx mandarina]|uniref:Uncharacterized protein LOC114247215 n=1 Tax=Bombyx mandarina TaxID=7092 RepID=A0A6J2K4J7_BOMMA|nr:uncharacterized protein LOC114247215 [Bombyx mandarina]
MWCWRKILRIPWTAFRTNVSILQEHKISSQLSSECLCRVLEYFGHIARKDGGNLEKLIVTGTVDGKRPRGRSPTRWSDQIRTALDSTFHNALHTDRDKNGWRKIVCAKVIQKGDHEPQQ